jgi:hypothetical protein
MILYLGMISCLGMISYLDIISHFNDIIARFIGMMSDAFVYDIIGFACDTIVL